VRRAFELPSLEILDDRQADGTNGFSLLTVARSRDQRFGGEQTISRRIDPERIFCINAHDIPRGM